MVLFFGDRSVQVRRIRHLSQHQQKYKTLSRKFVIVSPCRNEAGFMEQTLDSVVAQSEPPEK